MTCTSGRAESRRPLPSSAPRSRSLASCRRLRGRRGHIGRAQAGARPPRGDTQGPPLATIALLRSGYQRDSALWIYRLAVRCQQVEPAPERPAYAQRPRPKPGQETAEALLAAVPGISTTSARALLERFGGVSPRSAWLQTRQSGSPSPASGLSELAHSRRRSPSTGARSRPATTADRPSRTLVEPLRLPHSLCGSPRSPYESVRRRLSPC